MFVCIACIPSAELMSQPVIFINNGTDLAVREGAVCIVKASLTNSGYLSNESKIIIEGDFRNTDTVEGIGTDTFDVAGDWINDRTFIAGQSTVILSNSGNQDIRGTSSTTFYNLEISGSGVKSLNNNAEVSNRLDLNDLELATQTNKLSITATDVNAISRTTGFISSSNGGWLERFMNDTLQYFFPLGSNGGTFRFRPLVIQPRNTGSMAIAARFANVDATSESFDRTIRSEEICDINPLFYHQLERSQGSLPVDITLFFDPGNDGIWTQIAHWQNIPQWELAGIATQGADTSFTTLTLHDVSDIDYSPFALMIPLPLVDTTQTVITNVSCNDGHDGSICVSLLTGTAPVQFIWSNGDTSACATGLSAGNYGLTIIDAFCSSTYSFTINQPNNIIVTETVAEVSCKGGSDGSICLTVTGDFPPFTYDWFSGAGDSCLGGLEDGAYSVTVTDATGCEAILPNIIVSEPDLLTAAAQGVDVTCFGLGDGRGIAFASGGTQPYHYRWSSSDDDTLANVFNLPPGSFEVTVTDDNGCSVSADITIAQPDALIVIAGEDKIIFKGFTAALDVLSNSGGMGNYTYQWIPATGVAEPASPGTIAAPEETTTYTIQITDENGCIATDTLRVQVDVNLYSFPDAFLPNGSSIENRYFLPEKSVTVELKELLIFNRWGNQIFSLDEDSKGWNGMYKGKLQPMDTYVYQAVMQLPDGSHKTERGDFILIR